MLVLDLGIAAIPARLTTCLYHRKLMWCHSHSERGILVAMLTALQPRPAQIASTLSNLKLRPIPNVTQRSKLG